MRFPFLIFDLDGTLIDSAADLARAVNRVLEHYRRSPLKLEQIKAMIGDGASRLIAQALAARGVDSGEHADALRRFQVFYAADPAVDTMLYPGVSETIEVLADLGYRLAICTNKPAAPARQILQQLGIADRFERVVGGDTWPFRKPDQRMVIELIDAVSIKRTQTLMIGDSEVDAATAAAADIAFALVTYGYRRGPAQSIPKLVQFNLFEELVPFLNEAAV